MSAPQSLGRLIRDYWFTGSYGVGKQRVLVVQLQTSRDVGIDTTIPKAGGFGDSLNFEVGSGVMVEQNFADKSRTRCRSE